MRRRRRRRTLRLLLLALVALVGAGVAVSLREPSRLDLSAASERPETSEEGRLVLAASVFNSRGGAANVRWSAGRFGFRRGNEPLIVGLRIDGELVATARLGAVAMAFGRNPVVLEWSGPLRAGPRRVRVQLEDRDPPPPAAVQRGAGTLEIDEY